MGRCRHAPHGRRGFGRGGRVVWTRGAPPYFTRARPEIHVLFMRHRTEEAVGLQEHGATAEPAVHLSPCMRPSSEEECPGEQCGWIDPGSAHASDTAVGLSRHLASLWLKGAGVGAEGCSAPAISVFTKIIRVMILSIRARLNF